MSRDQIYQHIKKRYPKLNNAQILNIQSQVENKLQQRNENENTNLTHNTINLFDEYQQNITNTSRPNNNEEYKPRVKQPVFQEKINRNEFEDHYQRRYKEREDYTHQEYYNAMIKTGKNFNDDIDFKRKNFIKQESLRREQFEQDQEEREEDYNEKEKFRFKQFKKELDDFNREKIDPYKLFNLPQNFDLDRLKSSYKKLALKYHPDRGGDQNQFKIISKAYIILLEKYNEKQSDKQFPDLKKDYNSFVDKQSNYQTTFKLDPEKFNLDRFNRLYEENKQSTSNDQGYGDWKTENTSESPQQIFSDKFNLSMFNNVFSETKKNDKNCNQIINYNDPSPSDKGTAMGYVDIADTSISNFSSDVYAGLQYTDYKQAHTNTKLINIESLNRKEYRTVDELEKDRSNINYKMSEADLMRYNMKKAQEQEEEQQREYIIRQQNERNEQTFNKMNKLMIDNFS